MAATVVRVAALADLHCTRTSQGAFQPIFTRIRESADVLLVAGDLTHYGLQDEARVLAKELGSLRMPAAAVLGNHDFESGHAEEIAAIMRDAGLVVLEGDACELAGIGVAGVKGFGGGFGKHALAPWGEGVIKPRSGAVNRYAHDISNLKYRDAREQPGGPMTRDQIEIWTLAIRDRTNGQS